MNIVPFIVGKLFLRVNREKTVVAYIRDIKFLGYSFYVYQGKGSLRVHPKSLSKLKDSLRVLTARSNGWGNEKRKERLKQYISGWVNYFKLADMMRILRDLDSCLRRRSVWLSGSNGNGYNPPSQPDKTRHSRVQSVPVCQHKKGLLAHSQEPHSSTVNMFRFS